MKRVVKLNNSDNCESIEIQLSKEKTPIAWGRRVQSLIDSGCSEEEAHKIADEPLELEMYYNIDAGLFLVECEAVENGIIYDPYNGYLCDDADEVE